MARRFIALSFVAFFSGNGVTGIPFDFDCSAAKDSGTGDKPSQKFFYEPEWNTCLAFKYYGNGGNGNRFDSRSDCELLCVPAGSACKGPENINVVEPLNLSAHQCDPTVCPKGYTCIFGGAPICCHTENQEAFNAAERDKCPYGSKADGIMTFYFRATFAHSCQDLICGEKRQCVQVNKYFAKCCADL